MLLIRAVCSYLVLCSLSSKVFGFVNVTLMVYGTWPPFLVQSLPFMGPGFDLAVQQVQETFRDTFGLSRTYVSSRNVKDCVDSGAYFTDVVDYYYRHAGDTTDSAHDQNILILIYSGCDDSPMFAELGREWNIVVASCGTTFSNLRDRYRFTTTIAAGPVQYDLHASAILDLCHRYNWTTIGYVYDRSQLNPFNLRSYQRVNAFFRLHAPEIRINPFSVQDPNIYKEFNYGLLLDRISQSSRIMFVSAPPWVTREIMMRAYLRNQTNGEYVWFTVDLNEHSLGLTTWQRFEADDEIARAAFSGMFQIVNCWDYGPEIDDLRRYWKERTRIDYNSTYPGKNGPNEFTITAYGLVHVLAQVINESVRFGDDTTDARVLVQRIQNRKFIIPAMGAFRIDKYGERQNKVCINGFNTVTSQFETQLFCDFTNTKLQTVPNTSVAWRTFTGDPPRSEPYCGFTSDAPRCRSSVFQIIDWLFMVYFRLLSRTTTICHSFIGFGVWYFTGNLPITAGVLGTVAAALLILSAAVFHLKRSSQQYYDLWWKMLPESVVNQESLKTDHGVGVIAGQEQLVWIDSYNRVPGSPFPDTHASHILQKLRTFSHTNITRLIGIAPSEQHILFISEYAEKGSLDDALRTSALQDWELRSSLSFDLVEGLFTVHRSALRRHGHLSLTKCLITKRFVLKISGLGYEDILRGVGYESDKTKTGTSESLCTAPELRNRTNAEWSALSTPASDVYAFASIVHFLLPEHVFKGIQEIHGEHALRKGVSTRKASIFNEFQALLIKCRDTDPAKRPTIDIIRTMCQNSFGINNRNFTEKVLIRLERHAAQLEDAVGDRTQELIKETEANESLLTELLPRQIVFRLRTERVIGPEHFECISLLFSYIAGFTDFVINNSSSPLAIVRFLDQMFLSFDGVVSLYDVYKVETINDSCMVTSGLPERNGNRHALEICFCALGFRETFRDIGKPLNLAIKIGINTGPCVAGIVGTTRPRYCLFGDTINTASRVASHNTDWTIQITSPTKQLLLDTAIMTEYRGKVLLKVRLVARYAKRRKWVVVADMETAVREKESGTYTVCYEIRFSGDTL